MENDGDIHQLLYSNLIDFIQVKNMIIKQTRLLTNGCWIIIADFKSSKGWSCYKFSYNDDTQELLLQRRKLFFYSDVLRTKVTSIDEIGGIAERTVCAVLKL